jgi:hypothetical protein
MNHQRYIGLGRSPGNRIATSRWDMIYGVACYFVMTAEAKNRVA